MMPPLYPIAKADAQVLALLGGPDPRLYPFGEAPAGVQTPYAVYQVVGGSPENYLTDRADSDHTTLQVDVYAYAQDQAMAVAGALRSAIERDCVVTSIRAHGRDAETRNWRVGFDSDWFVDR